MGKKIGVLVTLKSKSGRNLTIRPQERWWNDELRAKRNKNVAVPKIEIKISWNDFLGI